MRWPFEKLSGGRLLDTECNEILEKDQLYSTILYIQIAE